MICWRSHRVRSRKRDARHRRRARLHAGGVPVAGVMGRERHGGAQPRASGASGRRLLRCSIGSRSRSPHRIEHYQSRFYLQILLRSRNNRCGDTFIQEMDASDANCSSQARLCGEASGRSKTSETAWEPGLFDKASSWRRGTSSSARSGERCGAGRSGDVQRFLLRSQQ